MKTSKFLISCVVVAASLIIVWSVGFQGTVPGLSGTSSARAQNRSHNTTPETSPSEPDQTSPSMDTQDDNPAEQEASQTDSETTSDNGPDTNASEPTPTRQDPGDTPEVNSEAGDQAASEPNEPNGPPMEALNLKDVEMKDIVKKITDWTQKVVIPMGDAMKQKITIFAPRQVPRAQALSLIYAALRTQGYTAEEDGDVIYLKPISDAKLGKVPVVGPDEPLAVFENREQIVQKFFKLENYHPEAMVEVIEPLIAEYGMVSADTATGTVMAIETINNLLRIERIIAQFDVPEAEQAVSELIPIYHGDPVEIVQLLRILLDSSASAGASGNTRGRYASRGGTSSTVITGQNEVPIVLIPQSQSKMIIARASAQDMKVIKNWIEKLDMSEPVRSEYETVSIAYADAREVARQIEDALRNMPGSELQPSVLVRPLQQSQQIMIFGRADLRNAIKELIKDIDIPTGQLVERTFDLKYADPEQIKTNIESLYSDDFDMDRNSYYYGYYLTQMRRMQSASNIVRVIAFPTMQQVTVTASPENMKKIEQQIKEWDQPLDVDKVKPRIIPLRNSDPVQMAQLLSTLFSSEEESASSRLINIIFLGGGSDNRKKIVGPLYGQLTFEAVPGSKKIIVISKIPEAYEVVEDLIKDLDGREMAEVPNVIQLKYADPETLAERLNALFNQPGTRASIRFSDQGLSDTTPQNQDDNNNRNANNNNNNAERSDAYEPWWNQQRQAQDEEPISNVIGKVRFIPDTHSKSLLVLAPPEFMDNIEAMVHELDIPGKQVLIKVVVIEVDHSSMTSLGLQLTSDPTRFLTLDNANALTALTELSLLEERGSLTLSAGASINTLVDFLVKNVNGRILNQQSLWTKDNEEASFFKGDYIGFLTTSNVTGTGIVSGNTEFADVGMTVHIRPSITPEDKVDLDILLDLQQVTNESVNSQPIRDKMRTTTTMIVDNGQTIMLGGILFQTDTTTERKVPLFGDLPVVGGAFRHNRSTVSNNEMIVFITPYVVDDDEALSADVAEEVNHARDQLSDVQEQLETSVEGLEQEKDQ